MPRIWKKAFLNYALCMPPLTRKRCQSEPTPSGAPISKRWASQLIETDLARFSAAVLSGFLA
jgi:hypothetical protein